MSDHPEWGPITNKVVRSAREYVISAEEIRVLQEETAKLRAENEVSKAREKSLTQEVAAASAARIVAVSISGAASPLVNGIYVQVNEETMPKPAWWASLVKSTRLKDRVNDMVAYEKLPNLEKYTDLPRHNPKPVRKSIVGADLHDSESEDQVCTCFFENGDDRFGNEGQKVNL